MTAQAFEQVLEPGTSRPLRSGPSINPSFIRFYNASPRVCDVLWANYEGRLVRYKTLQRNEFMDVNTFEGHPWVFRDRWSGTVLLSNSHSTRRQGIHFPVPADPHHIARKVVVICLPMFSLRERSCQAVADVLEPQAQLLPSLLIPRQLKAEISDEMSQRSGYRIFHANTDPEDPDHPPHNA